jgi:hypothetical protein
MKVEDLSQKSNLRNHQRIYTMGNSCMAETNYVSSKTHFFLWNMTSISLPPLPVANGSQLSVEIQTQVMSIPSKPVMKQ